MYDVNDLLAQAIKETDLLKIGEEFRVRDLFKGYNWNRIPLKLRLLLGRMFFNFFDPFDGNLVAVKKTSSGQQVYRKDR